MRLWAGRYLSFFAAVALSSLLAGLVFFVLFKGVFMGALSAEHFFWDLSAEVLKILALPQSYIMLPAVCVSFAIGLAIALPLFRWIAGLGWLCRIGWAHAFLGWALLMLLAALQIWLAHMGVINVREAQGIVVLVVLTLGFGWHVLVQRQAEARLVDRTRETELNAFA